MFFILCFYIYCSESRTRRDDPRWGYTYMHVAAVLLEGKISYWPTRWRNRSECSTRMTLHPHHQLDAAGGSRRLRDINWSESLPPASTHLDLSHRHTEPEDCSPKQTPPNLRRNSHMKNWKKPLVTTQLKSTGLRDSSSGRGYIFHIVLFVQTSNDAYPNSRAQQAKIHSRV